MAKRFDVSTFANMRIFDDAMCANLYAIFQGDFAFKNTANINGEVLDRYFSNASKIGTAFEKVGIFLDSATFAPFLQSLIFIEI